MKVEVDRNKQAESEHSLQAHETMHSIGARRSRQRANGHLLVQRALHPEPFMERTGYKTGRAAGWLEPVRFRWSSDSLDVGRSISSRRGTKRSGRVDAIRMWISKRIGRKEYPRKVDRSTIVER